MNSSVNSDDIICRDLNINTIDLAKTVDFKDLLSHSGFFAINNQPTHFKPNSEPSCIDLLICNCPDSVVMKDQIDLPVISHHDLIVMSIAFRINDAN